MKKDETIIDVLQNIRLWLFVIWLTLIGTMILNVANAAEWEIVSFDDPEHLAALTDSVIAVQNTAWGDTLFTCRRPVCVTIPKPQMPVDSSTAMEIYIGRSPGQAIIFYEEVER